MDQTLEKNYSPYIPADRSARILDYGCGNGRVLNFLAEKGYQNLLGVDIDAQAINSLPDHLKKYSKIIKPGDLPAEQSERFDLIILKDVVYYFDRSDIVDQSKKILGFLKPGGVAIVEVFNGALLTATYTAVKDLGIKTILTETSLRQLIEWSGLEVVQIFGQKPTLRSPFSFLFHVARKLWRINLRLTYILERGLDNNNPRLWEKSIIAIARRKN